MVKGTEDIFLRLQTRDRSKNTLIARRISVDGVWKRRDMKFLFQVDVGVTTGTANFVYKVP